MTTMIAEKIADIVAWVLQTDLPKHIMPALPLHEADYFNTLMTTSVILCFAFFYIFGGAVYHIIRYGRRISFSSGLLTLCFGLLCLSAGFIIVFRIYTFWYQDMAGSIYAQWTFTALIVLIALTLTILEYLSRKDPTKKEYQVLANTTAEVLQKHGIIKKD